MAPPLPSTLQRLFVTEVYAVNIAGSPTGDALIKALETECRALAGRDAAGRDWSARNRYLGYTSYGSVKDLAATATPFADLKAMLDFHVAQYAQQVELNLGGRGLKPNGFWVNILDHLGGHSGHMHPHSVISGTFYVTMPPNAGGLLFEDPRLPFMMNAPSRKDGARFDRQNSASVVPAPGTLLLWESWLRHEVPVNLSGEPRISISFNYAQG
ncbi:TIGR02466 family protein [Asticcacaulis solisilvae]|uniref:TIGR02466 family protein n=1 Tax=Asticcacaulis solisilvae TaxID=1217274 RepID=UPI003FD77480